MSYAILHMQKYKIGTVRGIQNHNDRLKISRTNPDIDYEKSKLNKKLDNQPEDKTFYKRIHDRIKELNLPKAVRKDAVVMCSFICTSDKTFFNKLSHDQKDRFFQESYDFLKERYSERNVIAATVHYDEKTPHMHFYFVPATPDGRLSAKSIFTPTKLTQLQTEYHQHMVKAGFDLERGISSDKKHLSVQEFKLATKKAELEQEMQEIESTLSYLKSLKIDLEHRERVLYTLEQIGTPTGFLKDKFRLSKDELDMLKGWAKKGVVLEQELKDLQKLKDEMPKLQKAYQKLQDERFQLQANVRNLSAQLQKEQKKSQVMQAVIKEHGLEPALDKAVKQMKIIKDFGLER